MKLVNILFLLFFITILAFFEIFAQPTLDGELIIISRTAIGSKVARVRPVGAIFSGDPSSPDSINNGIYKLAAVWPRQNVYDNIYGGITNHLGDNSIVYFNHDSQAGSQCQFAIGYGKYLVDFGDYYINSMGQYAWDTLPGNPYCYVDFMDGNYPFSCTGNGYTNDLFLYLDYLNGLFKIKFSFSGGAERELSQIPGNDTTIKIWHQLGRVNGLGEPDPIYKNCSTNVSSPIKGKFLSNDSNNSSNFPIKAPDFLIVNGDTLPFGHINPEQFNRANLKVIYNSNVVSGNNLSFNNSNLIIDQNKILTIGQNSSFIFDSSSSSFQTKQGSVINFPENFSLNITNGNLNANGSTFQSSAIWNGIELINTGKDSIINCTFNNAITSLKILNGSSSAAQLRLIKGNTFNVPAGGSYGVYTQTCYNINLQDNTFNMPISSGNYIGAYLKNSIPGPIAETQGEGAGDDGTMFNVIHNSFNNGAVSLVIDNSTSNFVPYYITDNTFYNSSLLNLLLLKANGTVKNNTFTSSSKGVHIFNSSPNFFGNGITTTDLSLRTNGYSYPNLSPLRIDDNLVWYGGKNTLQSDLGDNIQLVSGGNVYTDFGHNIFITTDTANYHIYGYIDTAVHEYTTRENCWYPQLVPGISLTRINDSIPVVVKFYNYGFQCNPWDSPTGYETIEMGEGIIDSTMISADNTGTTQTSEDILYSQGMLYFEKEYYIDAIANYKELINNFPSEYYVQSVVYELYACYEALDTNSDQDYRNTLYGNLSVYLDEKIQSELYSEDFNYLAYDAMIMCAANIEDYEYALNGYEFISLFHPDPDIRLMASWDYAEIEALIDSGSGGGVKQLTVKQLAVNINEYENTELKEQKEIERISEIISNDPIMSKLKKSFERTSAERKDKIEKLTKDENKNTVELKIKLEKSSEFDKMKNDKARRNLFELKNLSKESLEKRRLEDAILITKDFVNETDSKVNVSIPLQFVLEQNYPNPFNPSTVINYQLPVSNFVSLKVYDILGKEISTLVNQKQNAGRYEVKFNAGNFASGVYFYRIEAGDYRDIKRMVLIK